MTRKRERAAAGNQNGNLAKRANTNSSLAYSSLNSNGNSNSNNAQQYLNQDNEDGSMTEVSLGVRSSQRTLVSRLSTVALL
jgi:ribosome assembly protein YihI (activator of Der GTPase)